MKVAAIVPAFNEGARIVNVLAAILESDLIDEILVVSDGSEDDTAEIAAAVPRVRVIELETNVGKGGAMAAGAAATRCDVLLFVDADLIGLRANHVDGIVRPILEGRCEMCVGVFRGGRIGSNAGMRISPLLSGQRAMRRELFEAVPNLAHLRMGVEIALNETAKRRRARIVRVVLSGVSNCLKEEKLGLVEGLRARGRMYKEIGQAYVSSQRPRRKSPTRKWFLRDR